jgi:hypothetical protein
MKPPRADIKNRVIEILENLGEQATWLTLAERLLEESDLEALAHCRLTERPPCPDTLLH